MSTYRDCYGRVKRQKGNRSTRRMHLVGAVKLVQEGKRQTESFGGRFGAALRRLFAKHVAIEVPY